MTETKPQILLVGHCTPDAYAMRMALGRYAPDAEFIPIATQSQLDQHHGASGLLVNRVLDGDFPTGSGLDLIAALDPDHRARAALVSNLPDAQAQARDLGALEGFGKSDMYSDTARACIEAMLKPANN